MAGSVPRADWVPVEPLQCRRGSLPQVQQIAPPRSECLPESRKDALMPFLSDGVNLVVNYAVLIGLVLASIWVWAIVIDKFILFGRDERVR